MKGYMLPCRLSSRPTGRAQTCAFMSAPSADACSIQSSTRRHLLGLGVGLDEADRQRPAVVLGHPAHEAQLEVEVAEVGHELEHTAVGAAQRLADAEELFLAGGQRADLLAGAGAVVDRAGGGEADRPGQERLVGEAAHLGDLVGGGVGLVVGAPLPHHVGAQGGVGHLGADVEGVGPAVDRVEVLGEGLPVPRQALVEGRAGDVLHALHQGDEEVVGS